MRLHRYRLRFQQLSSHKEDAPCHLRNSISQRITSADEVANRYANSCCDTRARFRGKEKHTASAAGKAGIASFDPSAGAKDSGGTAELRRGNQHEAADFSR